MTSIAVFGGGGHAKVVIGTLRAAGKSVSAVYDDHLKIGTKVLGVVVKGPLAQAETDQVRRAILAIGSNGVRARLADDPRFQNVEWHCAVHPRAFVDESVQLGAGTVLFAGSIVQPDARIGRHVIVNTGASVDHDGVLADFVQLSPGVHLAGNVHIEREAFLGTGANVIPGISIGARTIVGAGACVVKNLPKDVLATGIPARIK